MAQKGVKPKDHMRDNLAQLRKAQEENKVKREEDGSKREEPFKMKRFQNVESRLHEDAKSTFALGRTLDPTTVSKLPRGLTEQEPKPAPQKAPGGGQ